MEKIEYAFLKDFDLSQIEQEIPGQNGRWAKILYEWASTDAKACRLTCASETEKKKCKSALYNLIKSHSLDWTYVGERGTNNVYVVRS